MCIELNLGNTGGNKNSGGRSIRLDRIWIAARGILWRIRGIRPRDQEIPREKPQLIITLHDWDWYQLRSEVWDENQETSGLSSRWTDHKRRRLVGTECRVGDSEENVAGNNNPKHSGWWEIRKSLRPQSLSTHGITFTKRHSTTSPDTHSLMNRKSHRDERRNRWNSSDDKTAETVSILTWSSMAHNNIFRELWIPR